MWLLTFESKVLGDLDGGHLDDVLALEEARVHLSALGQAASAHDHLVGRIDLVAALEQHVEFGREGDKYAVKGVVGLDAQLHRTAEYCVAGVHEARIAVDALGRLFSAPQQ